MARLLLTPKKWLKPAKWNNDAIPQLAEINHGRHLLNNVALTRPRQGY